MIKMICSLKAFQEKAILAAKLCTRPKIAGHDAFIDLALGEASLSILWGRRASRREATFLWGGGPLNTYLAADGRPLLVERACRSSFRFLLVAKTNHQLVQECECPKFIWKTVA